jgi:hypothetical protein
MLTSTATTQVTHSKVLDLIISICPLKDDVQGLSLKGSLPPACQMPILQLAFSLPPPFLSLLVFHLVPYPALTVVYLPPSF